MAVIQVPALPNVNSDVLQVQLGAAASQTGSRFNNVWYQFLNLQRQRLISLLASAPINVRDDAGAKMNGTDDSGPLQLAINTASNNGGGILFVPAGKLSFKSVTIPANAPPILIAGQSVGATTLELLGSVRPGSGMIDSAAPNLSISDLTIQTANTSPRQLQYSKDFSTSLNINDPMAPSLTNNTSVWCHAGANNFSCYRVRFMHASGYSLLLDATQGVLDSPIISNCWFFDNRASLFGNNPAALIYGSWNGGLLAKGDGRTATSGVVKHLLVQGCQWQRNTGNCVWSHNYGLTRLNEDFRIVSCGFEDSGLDSIEIGAVTGGSVSQNVIRRSGYVSLVDGKIGVPRWGSVAPVAIDSAGVVVGVNYQGNSITSPNGGSIDTDGHGLSALTGNVCRVPAAGDPEYIEDQIAVSGPNNNGSNSYGVNLSNSNNTPQGGSQINISANTFLNLRGGSVRLYAARGCNVEANIINAPSNSVNPPVAIGPIGTGPNQRAFNNRVAHNHISYAPTSPQPAVFEDDTVSPFTSGEQNFVYGNNPILPVGSLAVEFQKSPNSSSTVYAETVWF